MEDGSYTGYGQLDKDGNYVGPNPNDTSDEEDYTEESNWDDQEEDDYEEVIFQFSRKKCKKTKLVVDKFLKKYMI